MNYKRREFLKLTGGLALGTWVGKDALLSTGGNSSQLNKFGLQLYTIKDDLIKGDPKEILRLVAAAGYKQIESYEGPKGIFWGMGHYEFKRVMDDLGMQIVSSHCDINKDFHEKADQAAAIGMKYLICPSIDTEPSASSYKEYAKTFNECGSICKKAGIRFGYHNHDFDFEMLDEQVALEILLKNTDPSLVDFEMDIYWVISSWLDPAAWLKKYTHRFRLCHIKDRKKDSSERDASCVLGEGNIDFPGILKVAKDNGMKYYFVEQERFDNTTPLKAIAANAAYMKKLRF
ncbi:MAG: sugar phosphate isomerase/epimerase [Bacteroidetes bacterium]|nr:sugar phosphate isomerase/epimerase [Bacteroidota bacterium]